MNHVEEGNTTISHMDIKIKINDHPRGLEMWKLNKLFQFILDNPLIQFKMVVM